MSPGMAASPQSQPPNRAADLRIAANSRADVVFPGWCWAGKPRRARPALGEMLHRHQPEGESGAAPGPCHDEGRLRQSPGLFSDDTIAAERVRIEEVKGPNRYPGARFRLDRPRLPSLENCPTARRKLRGNNDA